MPNKPTTLRVYATVNHDITPTEYVRVHYWLKKNYGRASKCDMKDCLGISKKYEWALKRGKKYEMKRKNFLNLCKSCHSKYDSTDSTKEKIGKANRGRIYTDEQLIGRFKPVAQLTIDGKLIKKYPSVRNASRETGISKWLISANIYGRSEYTRNRKNFRIHYKWAQIIK